MAHNRTGIRHYARDLLVDSVDVGGRVFLNRPHPVFFDSLPCVLVYAAAEPVEVIVGDQYSPKEYQRNLRLNVDIVVEEQCRPDVDPESNMAAEDLADKLAWQIERAFSNDWTFARRSPNFDPNANAPGLLLGLRLVDTTPYSIDGEGDVRLLVQRMQWELPYESPAYVDSKYRDFLEYYAEMNQAPFPAAAPVVSQGEVRT